MPVVTLVDVNAICTAAQLGKVLGLGTRQIHHLDREGVLKRARCKLKMKRYRLAESVQSYLRHQRDYVKRECSRANAGYDVARAQRMAALAAIERLRLQQLRGEVLSRESGTATMTGLWCLG